MKGPAMTVIFKLMGTAVSIVAGIVSSKLVDAVWHKSTGAQPPKDDSDLEQNLRSVLVFAIVSSVVSSIIKVCINRSTQKAIVRFKKTPDET